MSTDQPAQPPRTVIAPGAAPGAVPGAQDAAWFSFPPTYDDDVPNRASRLSAWRGRRQPRPTPENTAPMSRVLSLVEPVVVMAFGALLGLMDQTATDTSGWLRVPALVAALLIVAQAITDFQVRRQEWIVAAPPPAADDAGGPPPVTVSVAEGSPGKAIHRTAPAAPKVIPVVQSARENPRVIYFVMGLSVWLALATLANPAAPWPLLVLSLLAAFLLFAEAWQMLRSRR